MTPLLCAAARARATCAITPMNSCSGIGGDDRRIAVSSDIPVSSSMTRKSDPSSVCPTSMTSMMFG